MKKGLIVTLVILAVILIGGCGFYKSIQNSLNSSEKDVRAKWAEVQNQYQRRYDLVDNLVRTVQAAAEHERSTLEAVISARARATSITIDPNNITPEKLAEFQAAQSGLTQALSRLMVVQEQYPTIQANENFRDLQVQLEGTENRIAKARGDYNLSVQNYNTKVTNFPTNIFAGMMGFKERPEFQADPEAQKAPKVDFSKG